MLTDHTYVLWQRSVTRCSVLMRSVALSVCLSVLLKALTQKVYFWCADTPSESWGQVRTSRSSGRSQGHRSTSAWNLIPPPPSMADTAQSRCNCSDCKSIIVIQGMTLPACSNVVRHGVGGAGIRRPARAAKRLCVLQISDPQTDRVMPERVRVSCSWVVCFRLKGNLVYSVFPGNSCQTFIIFWQQWNYN